MTKIINNNNRSHNQHKSKNHSPNQHNNKKAHKPTKSIHRQQKIDLKSHTIQQLYDRAQGYYQEVRNETKNDKWNEYIQQKGTKRDKITFVAAEIIKKPEISLDKFELLAKWTRDPNHNFALPTCQALSNIFIEHVFTQKPYLNVFLDSVQQYIKDNKKDSIVLKGNLIGYYLENHIKHFYGELIHGLTELLNSTIVHIKKSAVQLLASLSRFKELRRLILQTLINKFGDNDLEIVNEVTKSLKNQVYEDAQASEVLLEEASTFLFRENLSTKSQFYVVNFLNNINLKFFSEKSLVKLFELFFHFFNKLMTLETQQKSVSSRLFLNSIKGLNKIFAFMKSSNKQTASIIQQKVQTVYKTFHKTQNTKAKVQLLLFLFQSCTHLKGSISDRFYRVLYEFLSTNEVVNCSINQMFFDLLLLSMKEDQNTNRVLAFIKRLLQMCFEAESNFIATCLILINKIILEKDSIQIMMKQKENSLEQKQDLKTQNENGQKILPYDMNKRQPLYAGAEKTNLWQLTVFKNHYHPTVRKFVQHILKLQQIPYAGSNPLLELSLTSFVQKLSLRKQKKSDSWKIKVKRNLSKIRTSKYESLLEKPLQDFKQSEDFIKKYLQKRQTIHVNKKAMKGQDLEDFADAVVQKQLDRLNPREDMNEDMSISFDEDFEEQGDFENDQGQLEEQQVEQQGQGVDQDLQGDDDFADQIGSGQQFGDREFQQQGEDDQGYDEDLMDEEGDYNDDEDDEEMSQQKGFEDVFDDIGQEPTYKRKNKGKINKPKGKVTKPQGKGYKDKKRNMKKGKGNRKF